jgi:hypothetical protein
MILNLLALAAGLAFAGAPSKAAERPPEEALRVMLSSLRADRAGEVRRAMLGGAEELRDAVATGAGPAKQQMANRLPGMAKDPFGLCRDLAGCREAPQSLHVEDAALVDDAFVALARPWFNLQKARGKAVKLTVDPGVGVRLDLEDLPGRTAVTLEAMPTPTGGFDVTMADGPEAAKAYAAARAAVLRL